MQKDTSLDVTETIVIDFSSRRHGIFRIIPVRYLRSGGNYTTYLDLKSVTDENSARLKYSTSRQGNDLNVKIGDPDITLTGTHTYVLRYIVRRAINWFGGAPELYWNSTGNDWPYPIQNATARVYPPPGVATNAIKTTSYRGVLGSREPAQVTVNADHILFSTENLLNGQGMTLVAALPAGSLTQPSSLQNLLWFLADWWPVIFLPIAALGYTLSSYLKSGRDVDGGQAVSVEWNPPKNLTPAEVGTLVDERCDMADIVSTLVDLAARGYLVIEETQSEGFLFFNSKDYVFTRLPVTHDIAAPPLLPHEREFLTGLFGSADAQSGRCTLSSLKNNFYVHLAPIRASIYQSLTDKKMFNANPETVRGGWMGTGIMLLVLGVAGAIFGAAFGLMAYGIGAALAGIIVVASAKAMPSKTVTGSRAMRECLGFQRFIKMAEKDRIAVLAKDDPTIFGRLLPYAMVLGVADQWAFAFKDLMTEPPDWYVPYGYGHGYMFSPHIFVNDLGSGMNTMGNTFASQPQSTGGGGGSGFSGGGGSGGGFGGGGGGSW